MKVYRCTLWCDRRSWLGRPLQIEVFDTALDLEDSHSLQSALAAAAYRDRGEQADLHLYALEVRWPGQEEVLRYYRHQELLGKDGTDSTGRY